jgi:N-acetylglucosaminyl-diphospho-decaprenol L-rhamnosyltransferase
MSLSPPDVTVSIVNHANREEVLRCLEDLQAETGKSRIEIVVLDNDSHDGSVEAIRTRFPDVRVIAQRHTAGFGENHNTIIRQSTGRYIFVLNDDARVGAAAIDELVDYLDARPRIAALGLAGVVQSSGETPKPVDWVSGSAVMLRRSALDSIGLFDPKIYMYMEETDLCKRIWDAGYEVCYYPPLSIVHRQYGSTFRIPERRTNEVWRSRRYYWRKHHSALGRIVARFFTGYRYDFCHARHDRRLPRARTCASTGSTREMHF